MAYQRDRYTPNWSRPCKEAMNHGPADGKGKCPWCGLKIATAMPAPDPSHRPTSELTEAYNEFYDPDWGALTWQQISDRYAMGQNP